MCRNACKRCLGPHPSASASATVPTPGFQVAVRCTEIQTRSGTDIEAVFRCPLNHQQKQLSTNNRGSLPASPCSRFVTSCHLISHRHVNVRSTSRPRRFPSNVTHCAVRHSNLAAQGSRNREWFRSASTRMTLSASMPSPTRRAARAPRFSDAASEGVVRRSRVQQASAVQATR